MPFCKSEVRHVICITLISLTHRLCLDLQNISLRKSESAENVQQ